MSHITEHFLFGKEVVGVIAPGLFGFAVPEILFGIWKTLFFMLSLLTGNENTRA